MKPKTSDRCYSCLHPAWGHSETSPSWEEQSPAGDRPSLPVGIPQFCKLTCSQSPCSRCLVWAVQMCTCQWPFPSGSLPSAPTPQQPLRVTPTSHSSSLLRTRWAWHGNSRTGNGRVACSPLQLHAVCQGVQWARVECPSQPCQLQKGIREAVWKCSTEHGHPQGVSWKNVLARYLGGGKFHRLKNCPRDVSAELLHHRTTAMQYFCGHLRDLIQVVVVISPSLLWFGSFWCWLLCVPVSDSTE